MEIIDGIKKGLLITAVALLMACGAGSSSSSSGGPAYSGRATPAIVDNSNSKDFSDTTYTGTGATGAFAALDAGGSNNGANLKGFAKTFRTFTKDFDAGKGSLGGATAELVNENQTIPGNCGGDYSFNVNYDTVTGSFDGSLTFNNLDDCDGTVNGSVSYSGTINLGDVSDFKMSFSSLTFSDSVESITMNGSAIFKQISTSVDQVVLNMDYQDNNTNLTYRTENLVIVSTNHDTYSSETIAGKVYHPDYGYVVVRTDLDLVVTNYDNYPSTGIVVMTGATSEATVTFNDSNSYSIAVDENGDGTIDQTKACTWVPDTCGI